MSLLLALVTVAFDPAFMAAIDPPSPPLVFWQPKVVASGMEPADLIPR